MHCPAFCLSCLSSFTRVLSLLDWHPCEIPDEHTPVLTLVPSSLPLIPDSISALKSQCLTILSELVLDSKP